MEEKIRKKRERELHGHLRAPRRCRGDRDLGVNCEEGHGSPGRGGWSTTQIRLASCDIGSNLRGSQVESHLNDDIELGKEVDNEEEGAREGGR